MVKNSKYVSLQSRNAFIVDRNNRKQKRYFGYILLLLIILLLTAGQSFAAPATPNNNWKLVFDPAIDQPNNYSISFTPRVLLYNQGGNPVSGATVTYTYFDVNGNTQIATGTATGSGNSYSGAAINMPNYAGKYINVLFSVSAGSNTLQEQHVFFAGESNAAHGAIWKIEVFNTSFGPSWNGNSNQKIYMKLYSDAGIPFRNNFDIPTIAIWNSLHTVVQAATAMTYEEDGVYSYTISGYANDDYYFEIYNQWSGAPTGSTKGSKKYTKSYAGFYLEANNSQGDESPPEIVTVERKPYFPVDDDFVNITLHAVDNVDLVTRTLYFTVNNQTVQTKSMNALTGIEYRATLDPYLLEDNVRYNVTISDGTNNASSAAYMYNVQDNRGTPNMSHSFLNHPVYWFGKSRQASFADNGGDTNYDGAYSTTEKDNVAYLAVNKDYEFFKDMTRIKVQTMIMDETGKPVQHLTNVKAWLSNNTTQTTGTHNREKSMTEVPGETGVYSVTWEGSANVSGSSLVWNDDSKAIWGKYTSGEIYSVYIDVNNDGQPEENLTWLAYNFGDTFWGSAESGKTWDSHSDIETPGVTCGRTSCHDMVGGLTTRTAGDPACPDCHGVYKNANGGTFPVNSGTTSQKDAMIYGNSTSHPRRNITNATYCGDETCHNVAWGSTSAPLPAVDIPGYPAGTRLNGTFRSEYPNPMQCAEHHNYKGGKIPVEEGHNRMVACKYCHGGSHDNNKLLSYEVSINGTNKSNVDRGTPGYVGSGGVNGSGNYAGNCYTGCHKVQVEHSLTGKPGGAAENKFVPCDECHKDYNNAPMHQESLFPYDNRSTCGACHQDQGTIYAYNTTNGLTLNPPRIPNPQTHAQQTGFRWNNTGKRPYWVENENSCRYCHGRSYNEAYGLGRIKKFMGNNEINGTINSTSYWCSACHVNTSTQNYTNMVNVFNYSFGVVPPEITGSTWKSNRSGYDDHNNTSKINKEDSSTYSDEKCYFCHGGNIAQSAGIDILLHNVSIGTSGGKNCTACHDPGSGVGVPLVNFTSLSKGMHASLNAKASSSPENASNKPCWACHGTLNGEWANETDQPLDQHDLTYKRSARKCPDCHNGTLPLFEAKYVTDHIPSGLSVDTDVSTSKYNSVYCALCHNNSVVESFDPDGLGRSPMNASVSHYGANRTENKLMAGNINSTDCVFCHRNTTNMQMWGILPQSRANINNKNASGGGTNHDSYTASSQCASCHGNYVISQGFTFHDSALGKGESGGRNCIECHNIGQGMNNVNFSTFGTSVHATLNGNAQSSPQNVVNKPCWGCHGTINGTYANESDQPSNAHNSSVYKNPRKCIHCHITGSLMFTSKNVTDHIPQGFSVLTDVITSSYCVNCHNNSVNNGYEPDYMGIGGVNPMNASVSHYGIKANLIETIGNMNTSQGCIYCHYDSGNAVKWGSASDPRINIMRPHVETQNIQCWGCHIQGGTLPSTFHNENLFAQGGEGTAPAVPSGSQKIMVATNRYVILDDWRTGGALGPGFSNPGADKGSTNSWTGINTKINATAFFIDETGSPLNGKIITFNLYMPNGTELVTARSNITTNGYGLANFSFDMDVRNYYGNWTIKASNGSLNDDTSFIYNWWGCGISGCNSGHAGTSPSGSLQKNSPYLGGRESPSWNSHTSSAYNCTDCHQSFDGRPGGGTTYGGPNHTAYANDVHKSIRCDNANCHQLVTQHNAAATGGAVIGSCYSSACHTPANRSDISGKSTLNNSNKSIAHSEYSENNGTDFNGTFHTPNSTVPCTICHGPMHNITKPDKTQRFIKNNATESSHCTTCHINSSHSQNKAVNCSLCHSSDAHAPQFITNLTTVSTANYTQNRSSAAGCKDCHTSSGINSFFAGKGFTPKKNDSYGYNLTEHNDVVKCNTCHDRLHWIGYLNSTGMYQTTGTGAIACLDCHSGTNANVSDTNAYWGYMTPTKARHNNSVSCESCHSGSKHGIRFLQPDTVSFGSKLTPATCVNCHQQGYSGAAQIPAPINHSTNPYSGALWNGSQQAYWDNTSQLSRCSYCHGSVLHSSSALGNINLVKGANNLDQPLANSYWCANCHYKNAPDYAGDQFAIQPPEVNNMNGLVPGTAHDGISFYNHSSVLSSGYDDARCKSCHNNNLALDATSLTFSHNLGSGSGGGINCISCHDIGGSNNNVNFTTVGSGMHATLNSQANSSSENAPNKPCWGCHGTVNGTYANESDQPTSGHNTTIYRSPRKCADCHITGRLLFTTKNVTDHISSGYIPETDVNTSSYNSVSCSYCHNNSVNNGFEPDNMGITGGSPVNASVSHYGANKTNNMMMTPSSNSTDCVFCHRNSSNMIIWGIIRESQANISNKNATGGGTDHSSFTSSPQCSTCHGGYAITSAFTFHDGAMGNGSGASGGPDCKLCHDVNGAQKKVNFSAMNDTDAIHRNLNSDVFASDNTYNESKKCWACHGDGSQPSGHPTKYKTPSNCADCHINSSTPFAALQVSQHYWNGTSIGTAAITTCYDCHNKSEMMLGTNIDPDGAGSVYGGANGGSSSTSHYGKKRNDMASMDTTTYCNYCHNTSDNNATFYVSDFNNTILNHSSRDSTPLCSDCHNSGRIHNSTLAKPVSNDTSCLLCHGQAGSAATKNKAKHKTLNCTECHANSSTGELAGKDIHAIKYLTRSNTFETNNTSSADCVTCHQSTIIDSSIPGFIIFKIMNPLNHSYDVYNNSYWGNYWTSPQTSCIYCHNDSTHNSTPLGRINQWSLNYQMYTSIDTGGNCADCHYKGSINYTNMSSSFSGLSIPPEITNGTNWNGTYSNYVNHSLDNYEDQKCKSCHGSLLSANANMSEFLHNVAKGISGGPDCISCHNDGGLAGTGKLLNFSEMSNNSSIHKGLNSNVSTNLSGENKKCWACHGNGSEPEEGGHPSNYKNPYKCEFCHTGSGQAAPQVRNHISPALLIIPGGNITTAAYCSTCHNNSISLYDTNNISDNVRINASVSHYGTNASILRPTINKTSMPRFGFMNTAEAAAYNTECTSCHNPSNQNYGNPTQITVAHTSTGTCNECHVNVSASDLHNVSLGIPGTFDCVDCHTINASRYNSPNLTGTQMPVLGAGSCEMCHGNDAITGLFNNSDKHNVNRNYAGTPGNTGTVYLNDQATLTVTNGTLVTVTSTVNDMSGANFYASRLGGAEYYVDSDPGFGKGTPMDAADGQYDAVEGAWENVTGTINTSILPLGMHTVYVRGMDIGKQWSASQYATLTIQSTSTEYMPPAPVITGSMQGNFRINQTWMAGIGNITDSFNVSVNDIWTNGTTDIYSNISVAPHGWSNITVLAYNNSGSGRLNVTPVSNSTQLKNNIPVHDQVGNKVVAEGDILTFTVAATDADSDPLANSTNATKGLFNSTAGQFTWTPGYGDSGIYIWSFNSSDNYGEAASQTIAVTVNDVPLSIISYSPVIDPGSMVGNSQTFVITLNRTGNVTWYIDGGIVQDNLSEIQANYTNSTAGAGVYNVTAVANDGFDTVSKSWNWTVNSQPTYTLSGYVFDNYGFGLEGARVQNGSSLNTTSASGYYLITGLLNGTYNFSYSKAGFINGYLEITINGVDNIGVNKTIFDTTPPAQATGLKNDTPAQTSVNLTWNTTTDANYYQVFRNSSSLGYTKNNYWNDTGLVPGTFYEYWIRANDSYNNWGQNSSTLTVMTALVPDIIPPDSVIAIGTTTGNFFINNTWINPEDVDFSYVWFRYSNGTTLQNVTAPANYLNLTGYAHYIQNISAQTVDTSGNANETKVWFNATIPNNPPNQSAIENKTVGESQLLQFTVTATDLDSDTIIYGTNATKGIFNTTTGQFTWTPGYGDSGIYTWYFNSSDSYSEVATQTITVAVNNVPLSITSLSPVINPVTTAGTPQAFVISTNRTANITWYINGSEVANNSGVATSSYVNSTADIGVYNVTAIANDDFDTVSKVWTWTVTQQPSYSVSGYVFDNYGLGLGEVQIQNSSVLNTSSETGYYIIPGLFNGTYNFSYSKTGFNTDYLEITINGADSINANITIYDLSSPVQVTGLTNDTPAQTTVNLTWDTITDANYYQVFRNESNIGYTANNYWNDTGLTANTSYQYKVRANDSYNNWGENSSILDVVTAPVPDTTPPVSVSNTSITTGNFFINNTWINPEDVDLSYVWFRYSDGTTLQNVTAPVNYLNLTGYAHYIQNISAQTVDLSGNINQTRVWFNATIPNNLPNQTVIGNKIVDENQLLQITVTATDLDSDTIIYGTNATKGTFNAAAGQFTWTPGYEDAGVHIWYFNSTDSFGGSVNETITVTVNNLPLSITSSSPGIDPTTIVGTTQTFVITLNRTANVTWYSNGSEVGSNSSEIQANYTNSTAGAGVYNVTAIANDDFDTVSKIWTWTVIPQPTYNVSGFVFDNYGTGIGGVQVQNGSNMNTTSVSGYYLISGLLNGTYNFSYSKAGFINGYLEITINGADNTNVNKTIYDLTPPAQITGLKNDTPTQTTVNLTWDTISDSNYYQVFRNLSILGYTTNTYWNDTDLVPGTFYQYWVRANDSYDNWGQNSSILNLTTMDITPPASVSDINMTEGNFFINNSWAIPTDPDYNYVWFRYSNGTTLQNVTKPANYLNITWMPHYTQNISAQTVDNNGNINQTLIWFNTTIPNNSPLQMPIGNKSIAENTLLQINIISTDVDSDTIVYGTNATKGAFNSSDGSFSWKPPMGDAGVYVWYFNSSDSYGGIATETITITVTPGIFNNCLGCHNTLRGVYPAIVQGSFGKHKNLNTADGQDILNNSDCMICHYDVSNMSQPGFTTDTRTCTDCHTQGNFSAPVIKNHRPGEVNITTNASCSTCHNNSISAFNYNSNASVSHYGTTSSLLKPTVNQTVEPVFGFMVSQEAFEHNRECSSCHNPSNPSYGNATLITSGHTATATCDQCHLNANASNLHDGSFIKPVTSSCRECHMIYADIYKAANLTDTDHNRDTYTCGLYGNCHVPPDYDQKGILDPSDHNTDFTLTPGNKPTTDPVSLNDSLSLTVLKGENVAVSSRIRDNPYTASRVRGAEYYIDSDPGPGKGTVMSAADGYFDASGGAWENISANIDTYSLTPGNHTVYVRGMDIGKQWSTSVAATLIVLDSRGFVNGTVRNSGGYGIAGATVITNTGAFVKTDSNGFYSLDLTIGTYSLTATKEPEFYTNNTFSSVTITKSTEEIRNAILAIKPTGTISGVVTN